jgi:hypothetical protein
LSSPSQEKTAQKGENLMKLDETKEDTCADHPGYATLSVDEKFELLANEVYDVVMGDGDNGVLYDKAEIVCAVEFPLTPMEIEP